MDYWYVIQGKQIKRDILCCLSDWPHSSPGAKYKRFEIPKMRYFTWNNRKKKKEGKIFIIKYMYTLQAEQPEQYITEYKCTWLPWRWNIPKSYNVFIIKCFVRSNHWLPSWGLLTVETRKTAPVIRECIVIY